MWWPGADRPAVPGTSETTAESSAPAPASPTAAPAPAANIDGTLFFLGVGAAGGIYYLHNNVLTLAISDASFGFYQSATMSPDGQKLAWVLADAAGGTGQLRVQTYGGGTVTIGPTTISNATRHSGRPTAPASSSATAAAALGPAQRDHRRHHADAVGQRLLLRRLLTRRGVRHPAQRPEHQRGPRRRLEPGAGARPGRSGLLADPEPLARRAARHRAAEADRVAGRGRGPGARPRTRSSTPSPASLVPIADGGVLRGGFYRADGNAVLRVIVGGADRVRLVSPAGAVLDEVIVPPAAANHLLLGYAP